MTRPDRKKFNGIIYLVITAGLLLACSGGQYLSKDNPPAQTSVRIHLTNGTERGGVLLKSEADSLVYVDSDSHLREKIALVQIQHIKRSQTEYDFEGNPIPASEIRATKKSGKTYLYGAGGLILGTAVGTGVGIGLIAAGVDLPVFVSMGVFGISGAYLFGKKGADKDYDDALFDVRKLRYLEQKRLRDEKMQKQLDEERRMLEEKQKEMEELLRKKKEKDG